MPSEIERKFLVPLEFHDRFVGLEGGTEIVQAYLNDDPDRTVRVRIARTGGLDVAKMTVKGRPTPEGGGAVRSEWEWPMPVAAAREMVDSLNPPCLYKTRHVVQCGGDTWEVDVLSIGLGVHIVVAEFEAPTLEAVNAVALPTWVGREVTGDPAFVMSNLTTIRKRNAAWRRAYATE